MINVATNILDKTCKILSNGSVYTIFDRKSSWQNIKPLWPMRHRKVCY